MILLIISGLKNARLEIATGYERALFARGLFPMTTPAPCDNVDRLAIEHHFHGVIVEILHHPSALRK